MNGSNNIRCIITWTFISFLKNIFSPCYSCKMTDQQHQRLCKHASQTYTVMPHSRLSKLQTAFYKGSINCVSTMFRFIWQALSDHLQKRLEEPFFVVKWWLLSFPSTFRRRAEITVMMTEMKWGRGKQEKEHWGW